MYCILVKPASVKPFSSIRVEMVSMPFLTTSGSAPISLTRGSSHGRPIVMIEARFLEGVVDAMLEKDFGI